MNTHIFRVNKRGDLAANFRNSATKGGGEVACNQRNIGRTIEKKSLNITPIVSCLGDTSPEEETQELREVAAMGFRNFRCRVKHPLSLEGDGRGEGDMV